MSCRMWKKAREREKSETPPQSSNTEFQELLEPGYVKNKVEAGKGVMHKIVSSSNVLV